MDAVIARRSFGASAAPFVATSFLGAALIFLVQPMFARMATPLLGGAPAVWNVSLVCFQAALLGGYAYAHVLSKVRSGRSQAIIHAIVLAGGLLCLPLSISGLMGEPDANNPTLWLIGSFAVSIAPPFAAISATAPLVQHWYGRSGLPDAADPYHLYAASNIGSMTGLIAYPLLIEPFAPLASQADVWTFGYVVLAAGLLYAGWSVSRNPVAVSAKDEGARAAAPGWRQIVFWLALAFVPSSLLVGATSHITTDVAAAPFLWAPPLILYLLTFVIAFSKKPLISNKVAMMLAPVGAALVAMNMAEVLPGSFITAMLADLAALFFISLACHGLMNERRPDSAYLTQFYLIMSLGGVLGGAFNALVAPVIFDGVFEYPLVLIAGLALLAIGRPGLNRRVVVLLGLSALALVVTMGLDAAGVDAPVWAKLTLILAPIVTIVVSRNHPLGAAAALACAAPIGALLSPTPVQWADRSFFGVVKVVDLDDPDMRLMMHGTTVHGSQALSGDTLRPRTYYAPETPIGQSFQMFADAERVAVVGLGTGASACYAHDGQTWTFYEIDPLVVKVATDPGHFTFMSSCLPGGKIVLGDARIKLAEAGRGEFDFLLLDAFSSDSVPTHLLTREAMQLYLDRLDAEGVLVFHVSNRHLELAPVVARIADAAGAAALHQKYRPDEAAQERGAAASEVVMVSRSQASLDRARASGKWEELPADGQRGWTDDYSNIIGAMLEHALAPSDK